MNLRKLIKEHLEEAMFMGHTYERISGRIDRLKVGVDISEDEKNIILNNLAVINERNFPKKKSYGVFLGKVTPRPESNFYIAPNTNTNRTPYPMYGIPDAEGNVSVGTIFWAIIRENVVATIMLSQAGIFKNNALLKNKLKVDEIIKNPKTFDFNRQSNKKRK